MNYSVKVQQVQPQTIAVMRAVLKHGEFSTRIPAMMGTVWNFLKARNIQPRGHNVATYRETPEGMLVESGIQVGGSFQGTDEIFCTQIPGGTAATVTHVGPYQQLRDAHEAVRQWCLANGRQSGGVSWEVYGHPQEGDAQPTTQVFALLA